MPTMLHTEFSVYEIEQAEKRIRRIANTQQFFDHRLADGEWKTYEHLAQYGDRIIVNFGGGKTTITSPVQHIQGDTLELVP